MLLLPGGSAHRPAKRWPVTGYVALAKALMAKGCQPVLIGAGDESERNAEIADLCAGVINLTGRTSLFDIASLARSAAGGRGQ